MATNCIDDLMCLAQAVQPQVKPTAQHLTCVYCLLLGTLNKYTYKYTYTSVMDLNAAVTGAMSQN